MLHSSSYKTRRLAIDGVQVFTFTMSEMESSWREVLDIAEWSFQDSGGVVTVDGTTHWLTARAERVVALGLEDEHVTSFEAPLDVHQLLQDPEEATCRLTNVHERLGVLVTCRHSPAMRVDLWVLEEDEGGHRRRPARWSRKCSLMEPTSQDDGRWITSPHFTHGEYVLSKREAGGATWLYRHRVGDLTKSDDSGEKAQQWPLEGEEFMYRRGVGVMTFPFMETTEPLPICKPWETRRLGICFEIR
ncbi:hypothetical protein HU200_012303 [Digitaria exilis]|uniref:F-box protein n=1 Tax=Digitaria exilis TaxID=1010633 RepID=A0A835FEY1_9POAL|nr:hypothetical protein HU200_012303 [Digitaria exilis]